jgi:hypothetical protein
VYCKQTMNINTTTSNGVQHQPMLPKPRLATHSKKCGKSRRKVLHERPLMTALSREALMVEILANQNAILLKYIKGYEKKINDLMNEKRLNNKCNKQNVEFELEEQCKTLMRDSQNQSERSQHLSGQLVFLQDMNSKLEATLRGRPGNGFNNNITEKKKIELNKVV